MKLEVSMRNTKEEGWRGWSNTCEVNVKRETPGRKIQAGNGEQGGER